MARTALGMIVGVLGGQMGEAKKKQKSKALFVLGLLTKLSFTVCLQNASGWLFLRNTNTQTRL